MGKIAIIAPDEELYALAKGLVGKYHEEIKVLVATFDDCVAQAQKLEKEGYKVLISRGGFTLKLRAANIDIPVIDIAVSGYNVVSLLAQARNISHDIGVVGFNTLVTGAKEVSPILGVNVHCYEVESDKDFEAKILEAKRQGISVVVGGRPAVKFAEEQGMMGFYIKSRPVEVEKAIEEAKKILEALDKEREWGELLKTILDSIQEGVISIDCKGLITHFNGMVIKLLSNAKGLSLRKPIDAILPNSRLKEALKSGARSFDEIQEINGYNYTSSTAPIIVNENIVGAVAILQEVGYIQRLEQKVRKRLYQQGHVAKCRFEDILGKSPALLDIIQRARQYSTVNSTILIYGESGTGKEMFAQSTHNASQRQKEAFVAINCAAIPTNLLESELFGYVEGAFTGAKKGGKIGLFELAHNGTIFLDEISEISMETQARLLRVLEEKQIMRIGDDKVIPVNVRIIAATNKDLRNLIKQGLFREDLFYRFNVLTLGLVPLRERKEDIPILIDHFLEMFSFKYSKSGLSLAPEGMQVLTDYSWPGNIRELRNAMERLIVTSEHSSIGYHEVVSIMGEALDHSPLSGAPSAEQSHLGLADRKENELIRRVLIESRWNKSKAAQELGISRATLYRKIKALER
jgi:transcriptional regulator with PAS, ATPase and Fis domain